MVLIEELVFGYGGRMLYDGMSMAFADGAVYGLLGRNGAGKTTLMKLVAGLLKCCGGRIEVDGRIPYRRSPEFLDRICFVQESACVPDMRVLEYASSVGSFYSGYDREAFLRFVNELEVDPHARLGRLSFGQKKKAVLSLALSLNTSLLLLDEPGNGLDITSKQCFRRLLSDWASEGRTVVLSTHNVRDVADMVTHVAVIDRGNLLVNMSVAGIWEKVASVRSSSFIRDALFSEKVPGGYVNIVRRDHEDAVGQGGVDIEAFFDACVIGGKYFTGFINGNVGKEGAES